MEMPSCRLDLLPPEILKMILDQLMPHEKMMYLYPEIAHKMMHWRNIHSDIRFCPSRLFSAPKSLATMIVARQSHFREITFTAEECSVLCYSKVFPYCIHEQKKRFYVERRRYEPRYLGDTFYCNRLELYHARWVEWNTRLHKRPKI